MNKHVSKNQNRTWISLNYLSLVIILGLFYAGRYFEWPVLLIALEIIITITFFISFFNAFIINNLWKMVHTSDTNLDEREIQQVLKALRFSYSIFTIVTLVIIYIYAVAENGPIDVLLAGALVLFAHTLPAAVIGWNEKVVISE